MNTSQQSQESTGSNDGSEQNSYDEEYCFGRIPRVSAPCPFRPTSSRACSCFGAAFKPAYSPPTISPPLSPAGRRP